MESGKRSRRKKPSLRHHLATRVQQLRKARRWSQEDLATISGLHRTYISLIERARSNVTLDNVERLADAFDVPTTDLFSADGSSHGLAEWAFVSRYPASLLERRGAT